MLYKTHAAVGIASSLLIFQPKTVSEVLLGFSAAYVGSIISDIDVGTSTSHKGADKIILSIILVTAAAIAADYYWKLGLYNELRSSNELMSFIISLSGFITICLVGKQTPHRSFMHSFLAFILLSVCVAISLPLAVPYFSTGFASHIVLDFLNKKKLRLLYPLKAGFSLDVCKSGGLINKFFFLCGIFGTVFYIVYHIYSVWEFPV